MASEALTARETSTNDKPATSRWSLDPTHSSVEFAVRHMMVATVKGVFKSLSGTVELDEGDWGKSAVTVEIEASSVDTGVADRDNHLRSPDFFDAAKHPKILFRSTSIEPDGGDRGKVYGEVTLLGITRPVTLDVTYLGEIQDPWGNRRRGYAAETALNRKDFGMNWNQILDSGGVLVGDKVKVVLNVETVERARA